MLLAVAVASGSEAAVQSECRAAKTKCVAKRARALLASMTIGTGVAEREAPAVCGTGGLDVTVTLSYDHDTLGKVAAAYLDLGFRDPLALPDPATAEALRPRLTSLMPPEYRVAFTKQEKPGVLRVTVTTSEPGIPPMRAFKMRFDCPKGARARLADISCTTEQVVDGAGLPMPETLARQVGCGVAQLDSVGSD
jgi:hypothetical protein